MANPFALMRRPIEAMRAFWQTGFNPKNYSRDPELQKLWVPGGLFYDSFNTAGVVVTPEIAMTFSAVYDAVNQISSDIAKLPLNLHKRLPNGGSEHFVESKVYRLLKVEPNEEMGSMVFRRQMMVWALTNKGALAEIERDGAGRPVQLWPIEPYRWRTWRQKLIARNGDVTYGPLTYVVDGNTAFGLRDVIHIAGIGPDPSTSWSLIDLARTAIGLALATERFGAKFFENGTQFGGLLLTEQPVNELQRKALIEQIEKYHKGDRNAGKLGVFGGGFKYHETTVKPNEAQTDETRDRQVLEVARFYNMPPHKLKVNAPGSMSYASVEALNLDYLKGCLLNWITLWEEEYNRKLISPLESRQQFVKHNVDVFLRGDTAARTSYYQAMRSMGVLSANQILEKEDMNPIGPEGDIRIIQSGFVPLDMLRDIAKKMAEPTPAAPPPPSSSDDEVVEEAEERAAKAEQIARDAETVAGELRVKIAAMEATGTANHAEIERVRAAETEAIRTAAISHQQAEDLKAEAAALRAARDEALAAKTTAEQRAAELSADAERAAAEKQQADEALAVATDKAEEHRATADQAAARVFELQAQLTEATTGRAELDGQIASERERAELAERRATDAEQARDGLADAAFLAAERERAAVEAARAEKAGHDRAAAERDEALTEKGTLAEQLAAAEASRQSAEQALLEARSAVDEARTLVATLETMIVTQTERVTALEAIEQRSKAQADEVITANVALNEANQALAVAKQAQAEAERLQRAANEAETAIEQRLSDLRSAEDVGIGEVVASHRALLVHVMRGAIERETDRVRRNQSTPAKLRSWMQKWYDSHAALMEAALLPAVSVHLAWTRSTAKAVDVTRQLVNEHIAESKRQLEAVLDGDSEPLATSLGALLYRWESERVTVVADALMSQEIAYATRRRAS